MTDDAEMSYQQQRLDLEQERAAKRLGIPYTRPANPERPERVTIGRVGPPAELDIDGPAFPPGTVTELGGDLPPLSDGQVAQVVELLKLIREINAASPTILIWPELAEGLVRRGVMVRPFKPADGCACDMTPPSQWFTYYGAVEPGSQWEYNPACPVHSEHVFNPLSGVWEFADPDVQAAWETAQAQAALTAADDAGDWPVPF